MILIDSSIWIDHFRTTDALLEAHLEAGEVLAHSFILGELALGNFRDRDAKLLELSALPQVLPARPSEVRALIEREQLWGIGIGYVDAHLLASARLTPGVRIWTRDKRLAATAVRLGVG